MWLSRLLGDVSNLVYPPRCIVCGQGGSVDHISFCRACDAELSRLSGAFSCAACAMPLALPGAQCTYCLGKGFAPFSKIVALGAFKHPLRKLVHQIKYHHRWTVAEALADRLLRLDRVSALLAEADCIVAVPLHWRRQISRGYNQSQAVAERLAARRIAGRRIRVVSALARVRDTEAQALIHSRQRRAENLRQAFGVVNAACVRKRHVVLVDDVMTTQATLKSAGNALLAADPASLSAIVIAVADPRRRGFQAV